MYVIVTYQAEYVTVFASIVHHKSPFPRPVLQVDSKVRLFDHCLNSLRIELVDDVLRLHVLPRFEICTIHSVTALSK